MEQASKLEAAVLGALSIAGEDGLLRKDLDRHVGVFRHGDGGLSRVLEDLKAHGRVRCERVHTGKVGKPPFKWVLVGKAPEAQAPVSQGQAPSHQAAEGAMVKFTQEAKYLGEMEFMGGKLRAFEIDGQWWAVGGEVAVICGYGLAHDALDGVPNTGKGMARIHTLGGMQECLVVNEAGLAFLAMTSTKPLMREFKEKACQVLGEWLRKGKDAKLSDPDPEMLRTGVSGGGKAELPSLDDELASDPLAQQIRATGRQAEQILALRREQLATNRKVEQLSDSLVTSVVMIKKEVVREVREEDDRVMRRALSNGTGDLPFGEDVSIRADAETASHELYGAQQATCGFLASKLGLDPGLMAKKMWRVADVIAPNPTHRKRTCAECKSILLEWNRLWPHPQFGRVYNRLAYYG
jgi:hypothetical protein